jgi:hypothetical protein
MTLTRDMILNIVKISIAAITSRFNPADMEEETVLQDVDIDDDDHLKRLKNRIFMTVTDKDKAKWDRNAFMGEQNYAITDTIGTVATKVKNGIDVARTTAEA